MVRMLATLLLLLGTVALADDDPAMQQRLRADVEFLADDLLGGRLPGTPGYDIAAAFVASRFAALGLQPAGDGGGFEQQVPLRRAWLEQDAVKFTVSGGGQRESLRFGEQFLLGPDLAHAQSALEAEAVFVGYGIRAPALGHDDFAGLDLRGKVAVALAGQPQDFPSEEGAHFATTLMRRRAAAEAGAVALVTIQTPRAEKRAPWRRLLSRVGAPAMDWVGADGQGANAVPGLEVHALLRSDAAAPLLAGSGHTVGELLALDEAGKPLPGFALAVRLELAQRSRHESIASANVAAVLPGSDPLLAGEYLVYTAHLDHIGSHTGADGVVEINNGALDNAVGVAVMLETARLFAQHPPRRPVLFVAVTAEEQGLVGSQYFAQHPPVPVAELAGVINLDMPVLLYDFGDIIAFGAEQSTLGAAAAQAAADLGVVLTPDPFPEQNIFVRSDHYRFVQQGVPALFLVTGVRTRDGGDALSLVEGFLAEHYHGPGDDMQQPIHWAAAARFTQVNARIGELVADAPARPTWREGSFFGETFGRK